MVGTGHVRLHQLQRSGLEGGDDLRDCRMFGDVNLDIRCIELVQSTHADPTDDHSVNDFPLKRRKRHTHTMTVVLILVWDNATAFSIRVNNHKSRC